MQDIIAITGKMGSGKTTIANEIAGLYGYTQYSFADSMKKIFSEIFKIPIKDLYTFEGKSKIMKNGKTVRQNLQEFGTDMCRSIDENVWIYQMFDEMLTIVDSIIIDDARFPNEINTVHDYGGVIIWLDRKDDRYTDSTDHISENAIGPKDADLVIPDGLTIEETVTKIKEYIGDIDDN